eukprot:364009-Chlamydomonas_euryale.AAC.7
MICRKLSSFLDASAPWALCTPAQPLPARSKESVHPWPTPSPESAAPGSALTRHPGPEPPLDLP